MGEGLLPGACKRRTWGEHALTLSPALSVQGGAVPCFFLFMRDTRAMCAVRCDRFDSQRPCAACTPGQGEAHQKSPLACALAGGQGIQYSTRRVLHRGGCSAGGQAVQGMRV